MDPKRWFHRVGLAGLVVVTLQLVVAPGVQTRGYALPQAQAPTPESPGGGVTAQGASPRQAQVV